MGPNNLYSIYNVCRSPSRHFSWPRSPPVRAFLDASFLGANCTKAGPRQASQGCFVRGGGGCPPGMKIHTKGRVGVSGERVPRKKAIGRSGGCFH
jgi:hypothetical protein